MVRLVLTCERPDVEIRELQERLPHASQSCLNRLRLTDRDGNPFSHWPSGGSPGLPADPGSFDWQVDLPQGCSLAYERLEELLTLLRQAARTGVHTVLLGWRRELSRWRQESCRPAGPLGVPADAFWLGLPLPRGAVLRRLCSESTQAEGRPGGGLCRPGPHGVPPLPELLLCAALEEEREILRLPAPFLRLRLPVPGSAVLREEWIQLRDRAIATRRSLHGWSPGLELELRRHGRWLMAWTAAEQHCWEEALRWWRRGALQLPGSPRCHWFEAMRLFCRIQDEQPGPISVADLIRHPRWREQGEACLAPEHAPVR